MVSDMFMPPSGLRLFRNRSLHSSIHNFLLVHESAVMFRELRLVRGMRTEVGEGRRGDVAVTAAESRRVPQGDRLEKPPA